jgi:hypothetical protein
MEGDCAVVWRKGKRPLLLEIFKRMNDDRSSGGEMNLKNNSGALGLFPLPISEPKGTFLPGTFPPVQKG